jgi:hypothetical protein
MIGKVAVRVSGVVAMSFKPVPARALPAATALAVILTTLGPSLAGGKAVECYEPYRTAPVYGTVQERVLFRDAQSRVDRVPAIYGTQKVRRLVSPERVEYRIIPAQYRSVRERVEIYPETTVARTIPAVTRTTYRRVKVSDGGYAWEYRTIHGKRVLCKVKRKAVYESVAETVVVRPARVVHEHVPAQWGYQDRAVLVAEERREAVIIPAEYGYSTEQVLIQPEQRTYIEIPAEYQIVDRQVVVSEGSSGWRRVAIPRHCGG